METIERLDITLVDDLEDIFKLELVPGLNMTRLDAVNDRLDHILVALGYN